MADDLGENVCEWCSRRLHDHTLLQLNECATRKRISQMRDNGVAQADRERRRLYKILAIR